MISNGIADLKPFTYFYLTGSVFVFFRKLIANPSNFPTYRHKNQEFRNLMFVSCALGGKVTITW